MGICGLSDGSEVRYERFFVRQGVASVYGRPLLFQPSPVVIVSESPNE